MILGPGAEGGSDFRDGLHHGGMIGVEEGHAISEFIIDDRMLHDLTRELEAIEGTTIVGEVILDGGIAHFELIKLKDKVEYVGKESSKGGLPLQGAINITMAAERGEKERDGGLEGGGVLIALAKLIGGRTDGIPGGLLSGLRGGGDGLPDELSTTLVLSK